MTGPYRFAGHVKAVGIVEIVFQVLCCILVFGLVVMLVFGVELIASATQGNYYNYPSDTYKTSYNMIPYVGTLVLLLVIGGWLVYLVYTGGRKEKATRLTIWYIIQSILTAIQILLLIIYYFALVSPGWSIILDILYLVYRIYSIHVVRSHAEEINE